MSLDPGTFETLIPSRFIALTIPNTIKHTAPNHFRLHTSLLRVAVLDSPIQPTTTSNVPLVAAMLVPNRRETDWTFCTEAGHLQLLLSFSQFSRLILIGNLPHASHPTTYMRPLPISPTLLERLEEEFIPLLMALYPKSAFMKGLPEAPFLTYEDDVICSVVVERCVGPFVGELLVEDVELEVNAKPKRKREFRRRLRFKRMPNLLQTQLRILPSTIIDESDWEIGKTEFRPDTGVLVHPYLTPMVAGLSLIASYLDERIQGGFNPKALCLGVGGGALLSFLNAQLGFEVVGVEADEVVMRVARQFFGLNNTEFIRLIVGDGIELIEKLASERTKQNTERWSDYNVFNDWKLINDTKFDVIMVDLDSGDARMGVSAPPLEFVRNPVFRAARFVLHVLGILVINVIPPDESFYETLVQELEEVFQELYEIDVGNGENFVLIASASPIEAAASDSEHSFYSNLRSVISGAYLDSIKKREGSR